MRKHTLIAAALGTALMTSAAFAAVTNVNGVIKSIDTKTMVIVLNDGTSLEAPKGFDLKPFKVGEKVDAGFDKSKMMGKSYVLETLVAAK